MVTVDAQGLACPMPLLKLKQALHRLSTGERVELLATDAGSLRDVKSFADLSPHVLVSAEVSEGIYRYVVEKGAA